MTRLPGRPSHCGRVIGPDPTAAIETVAVTDSKWLPDGTTVRGRNRAPNLAGSIQRDAIVQSLLDHQGNKARGAGSLGMSRATIYRAIHEYGIVTPAS
jgi:transcriptional regulator of acetoin/glycerol metabolism